MLADQIKEANYFVKGDISGIQEFIFSVKSDGAAKNLKARSFFILTISKLCIRVLKLKVGEKNFELLFDGGGNFYAFVKAENKNVFEVAQEAIDKELEHENYYFSLSWCPFKAENDVSEFGNLWHKLQMRSEENKKKAFHNHFGAFLPFTKPDVENFDWSNLTDKLKLAKGFILITPSNQGRKVDENGIVLFGEQLSLTDNNNEFFGDIVNKLPIWDISGKLKKRYQKAIEKIESEQENLLGKQVISPNSVISFEHLAKFAWDRTGTDKIGVLKMDVDNLGDQFRKIKELDKFEGFSGKLSHFFSKTINNLLNSAFKDDQYSNNIYPVFSGGDDCFFVGGWDAIFEFAIAIHDAFVKEFNEAITISAGIIVVDSKFPVVRFAQMADEALDRAKSFDSRGAGAKNKIAVFDEVLTWDDYKSAHHWSKKLTPFVIEKRVPKSTLWRLQNAKTGYSKLLIRAGESRQVLPYKIWRLAWYLRAGIKSDDAEVQKFIKDIVEKCSRAMLGAVLNYDQGPSPGVFSVAGRWAEFSTRKDD